MFRKLLLPSSLLLALALPGCGSGEVDMTASGELAAGDETLMQTGEFFDAYTFNTREGFDIEITMVSEQVDSYLILQGPNQDGTTNLSENDDAEGGDGTDAAIRLVAPASGTYRVLATSYEPGEAGPYQITIRATKAQ